MRGELFCPVCGCVVKRWPVGQKYYYCPDARGHCLLVGLDRILLGSECVSGDEEFMVERLNPKIF